MEDLQKVIPNSEIRERKGFELKRVISQAKEKGFTTVAVVNEDSKKPSIFLFKKKSIFANVGSIHSLILNLLQQYVLLYHRCSCMQA